MTQLAIRMSPEQLAALDRLVADGRFATRTAAVRDAVDGLLERERRRQIGQSIAEGYRRVPQTDEDEAAARVGATASIEEEPW